MAIRMSTGLKNAMLFSQPLMSALAFGVIHVYSGQQPASANDTATGTLIGSITRDGLGWTEGASQGGLTLSAQPSLSYLTKPITQSWVFTATSSGSMEWFRFRSNSSVSVCFDGVIDPPYDELFIGSKIVSAGETRTIDAFQISFYW